MRPGRTDGQGVKAPFLPQHDEIPADHPHLDPPHQHEPETRSIVERVRSVTAGIPGLNQTVGARPRAGRAHVITVRPAAADQVYRDESVHLVLSSDLEAFGPGAGDDEAGSSGYPITLTVGNPPRLSARPPSKRSSFEGNDWFLDHRGGSGGLTVLDVLHDLIVALNRRGLTGCYEALVGRHVRHLPAGRHLGGEPTTARRRSVRRFRPAAVAATCGATTRRCGRRGHPSCSVKAPSRPPTSVPSAASRGSRRLDQGLLTATAPATGRFGEPDWDSFRLQLTANVDPGGRLSAAVLIDAL